MSTAASRVRQPVRGSTPPFSTRAASITIRAGTVLKGCAKATPVVALVLTGCSSASGSDAEFPQEIESPDASVIEVAQESCDGSGEVADGGKTILFDTQGEADYEGHSIDDVACVLLELDVPDFVVAQLDATRALDGRQSATWDTFEASWTYHPDDGLDLIITEVD